MRLRSPLPELNGAGQWLNRKVSRRELVGERPTLVHFWSISCYLCKKEMSEINKLIQRYNGQLNVLSVHMPRSEEDKNIKAVQKLAAQYNMVQPIYVDNDLVLSDQFEIEFVPSAYLFDHTGQLRHFQVGGGAMNMLERRIQRLIGI